jgi:hypothetical protein
MSLLQSCVASEGCCAHKIAVHKSSQGEVASSCVAKAAGYRFDWGGAMLFDGFPECERFIFEGLTSDLPPGGGIAFDKRAYIHWLHSKLIASDNFFRIRRQIRTETE